MSLNVAIFIFIGLFSFNYLLAKHPLIGVYAIPSLWIHLPVRLWCQLICRLFTSECSNVQRMIVRGRHYSLALLTREHKFLTGLTPFWAGVFGSGHVRFRFVSRKKLVSRPYQPDLNVPLSLISSKWVCKVFRLSLQFLDQIVFYIFY